MDRRSWPWKKKPSDASASHSSSDSPTGQQQMQASRGVDNERARLEEDKVRHLSTRLSVAAAEIASKDELVRQHAKVAEEAVSGTEISMSNPSIDDAAQSGWEKAEKEASSLKKELEVARLDKSTLQDKVAHLDAALKECMRELWLAREEQEQRILQWDRSRKELESKLFQANDRLVASEAQRNVLSSLLQERAKAVSTLTEAKSRTEAEAQEIRVQKEEIEKVCFSLRYELQVLSKQVDIRNEENENNKKVAEAASKQHLENVKKISQLEAECQRLRRLVRKRLPGPAALAQMKLEVEVGGAEQRVHELEEETKLLKELLSGRSQELEAARLACAELSSKISRLEDQLSPSTDSKRAQLPGGYGEEEASVAQQFKQGNNKIKLLDPPDLMDDFVEMERLATTSTCLDYAVISDTEKLNELLMIKEQEIGKATRMCEQLQSKLASAEQRIKDLQQKQQEEDMHIRQNARQESLAPALLKILRLVEEMAKEGQGLASLRSQGAVIKDGQFVMPDIRWNDNHVAIGFLNLVTASNNLLNNKFNAAADFLKELSSFVRTVKTKNGAGLTDGGHDSVRKTKLEEQLRLANETIEELKAQLLQSDQSVSKFRTELASMEQSKRLAENELTTMVKAKAELESKVRASAVEMGFLQETVTTLRSELKDERTRLDELRKQSKDTDAHQATKSQKELEVAAEKLAECQRTILVLGKQLQSLSLPSATTTTTTESSRGSMDFSESSSMSSEKVQRLSDMLPSESEEEDVQWTRGRTASDMGSRRSIRKQEVYWSSAASTEDNKSDTSVSDSSRLSGASRPQGFSRFFLRSKGSQ